MIGKPRYQVGNIVTFEFGEKYYRRHNLHCR